MCSRNLQKATTSFKCLSVCPHATTRIPVNVVMKCYIWVLFENLSRKSSFVKIWQEWRVLHTKANIHLVSHLPQFLLEWEMFQTNVIQENQNTHLIFNHFFPRKSCSLWDDAKKYCTAGQATDDNMAHAHCMLDTEVYKHTLIICSTNSFSTATLVVRTRLNVTLHVHYLSGFIQLHVHYRWKHIH